jgi:hypothetical protein
MPRSLLRARTRIPWSWSTLVVVLWACYETLKLWIEYAYLQGMKMSYCSIWASRALLIGPRYVPSEVVVRCLSIAQCTLILEWEPQSVPLVWPYGRIVLKSGLRWSATWWRGAAFLCRKPVERWVLARGIDRFPIATLDPVDSSGFAVRISPRNNLGDRVMIVGRARKSIRSIVAGCWNRVEVETHVRIWIQEVPKSRRTHAPAAC